MMAAIISKLVPDKKIAIYVWSNVREARITKARFVKLILVSICVQQ